MQSVSSDKFAPVVDSCTLCDMCFETHCPYVPPHEFNIDFPHLMLRYRMYQKKQGQLSKTAMQLAKIDRNAKIGIIFSNIIEQVQVKKLLNKADDHRNAILSIHPGAGGTESQDWASMLYRLYIRWCEKNNYKTYLINNFNKTFKIKDKQIKLFFSKSKNPYN